MAAKDYKIVESGLGNIYFAKKTKGGTISQDRRLITDNEIIGMFHRYLKRRCEEVNNNNIIITDSGKKVFEVTLYDFKKIEE